MKNSERKLPLKELDAIAIACGRDPSLFLRIAREMTDRSKRYTGKNIMFHRQEVRQWLNPDVAQRTEPRLSIGKFLEIVGAEVVAIRALEKKLPLSPGAKRKKKAVGK